MTYVLAWIVVGFCSFLITKNNWEKALGKYGMAIWAHCRVERSTSVELQIEDADQIRNTMNIVSSLLLTIIAPFGLWLAFKTSLRNPKINEEVMKVVNEYVSKHGMIF